MRVEEVRSLYNWNRDQLVVTQYITHHFPNGNDVHTTIQKTYEVMLYTSRGREAVSKDKGNNINVLA